MLANGIMCLGRVGQWGKSPKDGYVNTLIGGSIGGIVLGVIVVVLVSLPLCCGVLKQYGKAGHRGQLL